MPPSKVCLIGGTGFVGRYLAGELTRRGYSIKVLTRRREKNRELLVLPRLELVQTNVHFVSDLTAEIGDCEVVVNLAGILNEGARDEFKQVHADLPAKILEACEYHRIERVLHVSALGAARDGPSRYLRSKWEGERALEGGRSAVAVTIFRPSVVFGPGDSFFTRFAELLTGIPFLFPLASPDTRFQPVYVGDVARALCEAITRRATRGRSYNLCGPHTYTLEELVGYTANIIGVERRIVRLSRRMAELQARVLEHVPGKPFSLDNLRSLEVDSVCESNDLASLGIPPTGLDAVVPRYLGRENRLGRHGQFRRVARR